MKLNLNDLLHQMVERDASDLHIKVGSPPGFRISGSIQPMEGVEPLKPEDTESLVKTDPHPRNNLPSSRNVGILIALIVSPVYPGFESML